MLTPEDLAPFSEIAEAKAQAMIDDAIAMASLVAPCISPDSEVVLTPSQQDTVKAVMRRAVLRWNDLGTGAITQQTSGPFTQSLDTTRATPRSLFWPSEIADLQAVCKAAGDEEDHGREVFTINTGRPRGPVQHAPICDLNLGGTHCSCGSYLNNLNGPIPQYWEMP